MLNPLRRLPYAKLSILSLSILALNGCSSLNTEDASSMNGDYRETNGTLSKNLEIPPNLISPVVGADAFYTVLGTVEAEKTNSIPSYQAKGLRIQSNLTERWLEMDTEDSQRVWTGVQTYLKSLGMPIEEARKDIGVIKTEFVPRKEIVPLDDQGPLTKLLNSWRTEFADGAYDRLIARVETDDAAGKTRVYFHHYMLYTAPVGEFERGTEDAEDIIGKLSIKPYNPLFEAEALYQAMIFFGADQANAVQQIQITENRMEMVEGTAFDGVKLKANLEESWGYLKAMVYRADWTIDKVDPDNYQAWLKVPDEMREEKGFFSKMAFWRDDDAKVVPEVVRFDLKAVENEVGDPVKPAMSVLTVRSLEDDEPLNEKQREYLFELLGFTGN